MSKPKQTDEQTDKGIDKKADLLAQVKDALTQVSRLPEPDLDYIAELQQFKVYVEIATDDELKEMIAQWGDIDPRPTSHLSHPKEQTE